MNLLLVAATKLELKPLLEKINRVSYDFDSPKCFEYHDLKIDVLITGIGLVFTTYHLSKVLAKKKYDLVLNLGIAGSFTEKLQIGDVVHVEQEEFCDLGIESSSGFQTLFESEFIGLNKNPFKNGKLILQPIDIELIKKMPVVKSISSNTAHGNENTIRALREKFSADIESMEGAAFFYVCLMEKVRFVEIRAISNYVESRDTSKWNIPLALENLNLVVKEILDSL